MRTFPIKGTDQFIPYDLFEGHSRQALINHDKKTFRELESNVSISIVDTKEIVLCRINEFNKRFINTFIEADKLGLRPCSVCIRIKGQPSIVNAIFHRWFDGTLDLMDLTSGQKLINKIPCVKALVEFEDGTVGECHYKDIQFTDRGDVK